MPGPLLPESEIRSLAQKRIEEGRLPVTLVRDIDGGYGHDHPCSVCGQHITAQQVEYEISADGGLMRFHLMCFAEWQLECAQRIRSRPKSR